jgi:hypothetical protein
MPVKHCKTIYTLTPLLREWEILEEAIQLASGQLVPPHVCLLTSCKCPIVDPGLLLRMASRIWVGQSPKEDISRSIARSCDFIEVILVGFYKIM